MKKMLLLILISQVIIFFLKRKIDFLEEKNQFLLTSQEAIFAEIISSKFAPKGAIIQ